MATGRMSLYDQWNRLNPLGAKPVYDDKYGTDMQDLYAKISSRGPFQYDATKDPLFQSYKDNYVRQGKLAMKDTMGQAAALTGGYGNTYGQQVGQQAYDAYLQNLGDVIPQLYGMAFDQYKDQGDQLLQQYSLLGDMSDRAYGQYRDELGDWMNNAEFLRALEADEYNRDMQERQFAYQQQRDAWDQAMQQQRFAYQQQQDEYQRQWNEESRAYERAWNEDNRMYQREQDAYTREWNEDNRSYSRQQDAYQNLYKAIASTGYKPTADELAAAGMSKGTADALRDEYFRNADYDDRNMAMKEWSTYNAGSVGGGGGGSSGGGRSYGGGGGGSVYYDTPEVYGGDIWNDSQAQYKKYGFQDTANDLNDLWKSGAITANQAAIGRTAATVLWNQDHALSVVNAVKARNNNPYSDGNYGPEGDTMALPTTDAGKARLEKLKKKAKK